MRPTIIFHIISAADGLIRKGTVGALGTAGVAGVSALNGFTGGLNIVGGDGMTISVIIPEYHPQHDACVAGRAIDLGELARRS